MNIMVDFENGDNVLFYVETESGIDTAAIKRFAEKVTGNKVLDCYQVKQEELEFYCIDGRVWIDTPEKIEKIKQLTA